MTEVRIALRGRPELAASPTWDVGTGTLLWVDTPGCAVHRFVPETGADEAVVVPQPVGAAKPRTNGGLVLNLRDGIGLREPGGALAWLVYWHREGMGGSDAAVDPVGRLWAGTKFDGGRPGGYLASVEPDGRARVVVPEVPVSSGIGWSPDERRMYYVDSPTGRIDVFDYDAATGDVSGRRPLCVVAGTSGAPAGLCVDEDGCVWVAVLSGGQVRRYTPDGELDRVVEIPVAQVTACCFGGTALDQLYVTTGRENLAHAAAQPLAGALFVVEGLGVSGLPCPRFPR